MGKEKNRRKIKEIESFNGQTLNQIAIHGLIQFDVAKHDAKNDVDAIPAYDDEPTAKLIWWIRFLRIAEFSINSNRRCWTKSIILRSSRCPTSLIICHASIALSLSTNIGSSIFSTIHGYFSSLSVAAIIHSC